ncbi:microtubule-associated tyrosine carboxypeptidase-like isoform X2 [Mya arenaria]|uniref:microtubule-associated tyrosine carboxypeptidase-like isoform X2 n=1 Tax=Mya arenaria TaxID=6604 RepID=UPI0022E0F914|nr:microtubule-associated tyrosine carboxypeptidase-like isoform X2 [Mya arenaria]
MTKKVRQWRGKARTTASVIKSVNKDTFASAICPTNVEEQKQKFLEFGKTPEFQHRGTETELEEIYSKPRSEIRFDLLGEALHILKTVKEKYGDAENYYSEMYGEKISKDEATDIIVDYLKENRIDGQMTVIWCSDLPCSGRMMWQGPHVKYKRPEARKYSMWIKDSKDNNFLRLHGIRCLSDHEIGTHFFRSYNDGLQPWFADRTRFGLRGLSCLDQLRSEEGLAAINTILNAKVRYLWGPALLYYIACKATEMTFKQLFEHLSIYVANPEWRWRHCVRVKRGLLNPNDIGGYGKDQCYFEGAVEILRNLDNIDFRVMMSGKVCWDEISRVKKLARLECIQMPAFMRNQEKYKKTLKQIAHMNGLHMDHAKFKAPLAYLRRLKRGRRIGVVGGSKKVRRKGRRSSVLSLSKGLGSKGEIEGSFGNLGSDNDDDVDDESGQDSGSDEGFYFQQYSLQGDNDREQDFFEKLKKNVGKNGEENEVTNNYSNYYKSLVNNFENLKKDKKQEETKEELVDAEVKSSVISYKKSTFENRDWENDCVKTQYRCVSRASVQMLLSLPSNSLNSRNRNSNAEDVESIRPKSYIQRPLSSFVPSLVQDDEQTADLSNSQGCGCWPFR